MNAIRTVPLLALLAFVALVLAPAPALAQLEEPVPNDKCLECHGLKDVATRTNEANETIDLFTDEAILKASVHATNACVDCHKDLEFRWDHPDDGHKPEAVDCSQCHVEQSATARASAHGIALRAGTLAAATCKDCHGDHDIRSRASPDSATHYAHLAETCGQCHPQEQADLEQSVHGRAALRGDRQAPTCIDCHSEHQIEDLRQASPRKIAEQVCGKCHSSLRFNTQFRVRRNQVDTFLDSYHGLAVQGGSTRAANCASCHGWHLVLPSSDERSTIHPDNLVATCGQCHPGIGRNFTSGKVHMDDTSSSELGLVVNRWVRRIYLGMIVVVISFLALHNGAAWYQKAKAAYRAAGRTVVRMDRAQRAQHLILLLSFIILAITGFALRFPDSLLFAMLGSEDVRRWLHRAAGVVLLALGFWHIGYLIVNAEGRRLWRDLQWRWKDWHDFKANARHLAGRSRSRARFGRFGYAEKIEYWAVLWGTIIMGVTGLMIWLKVDVTQWVPRWWVDVASTVHYYEAILACLAILVWHIYHVIFDPDVYPGNWAWLDGRVTPEWQHHEHPLDTRHTAPAPHQGPPAEPGTPRKGQGSPIQD